MNKKAVNIVFYVTNITFVFLFLVLILFFVLGTTFQYQNYRKNSNIMQVQQQIDSQYKLTYDNGYSRYLGHDIQGIYIFEVSLNSKTEDNQFTSGETFYVAYNIKQNSLIAKEDTLEKLLKITGYISNYIEYQNTDW